MLARGLLVGIAVWENDSSISSGGGSDILVL